MPVTCYPAAHGAKKVTQGNSSGWVGRLQTRAQTSFSLMQGACKDEAERCKNIIQSSFDDKLESSTLRGTDNGFIHAVVLAYSNHHHLIIRPDDVWVAVLSQLSVYVNAHTEELRSLFVTHEGQKELTIEEDGSERSFGDMARRMTKLMESNIVDPALRSWVMQEFSTTTDIDRAVTAIAMMGTLQGYFSYRFRLKCGLPSVTLLGERDDWVKLLNALERLPSFGKEPTEWTDLLRVVFKGFVDTFDDPKSSTVIDFWQRVAHYSGGGSGPRYLSGWISAFSFWNAKGECLRDVGLLSTLLTGRGPKRFLGMETPKLRIGNVVFHRVSVNDLANGWISVPVILEMNGASFPTTMIAGVVAIETSESGNELEGGGKAVDTLQPAVGWWIFERSEETKFPTFNY